MVNSVLLFGESLKNAQFLRIITLSSNNITSRISIPKGHIESVLRSFYPMFDFDRFIENIVPEHIRLGDGEISFKCSDRYDGAILRGASAVMDEKLTFSDWNNDQADVSSHFNPTT